MHDDECIGYEKLRCPHITNVTQMGFVHVRLALVSLFIFVKQEIGSWN
jgi:hypothetical protein